MIDLITFIIMVCRHNQHENISDIHRFHQLVAWADALENALDVVSR